VKIRFNYCRTRACYEASTDGYQERRAKEEGSGATRTPSVGQHCVRPEGSASEPRIVDCVLDSYWKNSEANLDNYESGSG
jgi:hypothetical protein